LEGKKDVEGKVSDADDSKGENINVKALHTIAIFSFL